MKAGLLLQIGVIALFCIITSIFHRRCIKGTITSQKVQGPLVTLYISMTLILIRTIYRIIEHFGISTIPAKPAPDWDPMTLSPILRYEWFFWVFEASLYHVYLAQDGLTELRGPGWKDDMPWFMTFIDPCGMTAAVTGGGRRKEKPFWETDTHAHSVERQEVDAIDKV
jgi:hypothetical protein